MRKIFLFLFAVIFLCNCQQKNKIVVSENNGVIRIQNPDTPVQKNIKHLRFEEVFRLGENMDDEHEIFHGIINLNVDKNRNLYIVEQGNKRVQQFDDNGNFLRILGRSGRGPGEYMFPVSILMGAHDEIIVLDGQVGKLIYFDAEGTYLKDDRIRDKIHKSITSPQFVATQRIIFSYNKFNPDPKSSIDVNEVYSLDLIKRGLKKLLQLNVAREVITGESGASIFRKKWQPNIAVSPEGEIFVSNGMDFLIDVYNKEGQKLREIMRKYKTVPLSQKEKESFKGGAYVDGKTFSPPDNHADIQALFFVIPNECWVITSHKENEKCIMDVFDDKGRFVRQLSVNIFVNLKRSYGNLPLKLIFDEPSKSLFLYQVEKNEDDVEQVVCYRAKY